MPVQTTLRWKPALEAVSYRLHVYSMTQGVPGTIVDQIGITDTMYQVSGLEYSTKYFWEVRGANAGGESLWSETWNFTTVPESPAVPSLVSPAQMAGNISISPSLAWSGGDRAEFFQIQVATDVSFSAIVFDKDSVPASPLTVVPALQHATKYFWRVRARNTGGVSSWSGIWYFITADAPPPAPLLVFPADSAMDQGIALRFRWDAVAGATSYHLQLATDAAFSALVRDSAAVKLTECQIGALGYSRTYHWRVRASNAAGPGAWSAVRMFSTAIAPPPVPALSAPADNAANIDTAVTLSWQPVAGASSYRVQLSVGINFSTTVVDSAGLAAPACAVHSLRAETLYFWRVEAVNSSGGSGWSAVSRFTTRQSTTAVDDNPSARSRNFTLSQNYPNPVVRRAVISFQLPTDCRVALRICDTFGRLVETLVHADLRAGMHTATFDAESLAPGVYLYMLETGQTTLSRTMIIMR
ncbi:MAG: T9SS type A sorting domain-containing protein [Ignavibacteria bacterium]|nr:T9SS type A sorting domain-containing protein [Ignavibacteria bacterium]